MGGGSGSGCGVPMKTCKACSKECNIGCKKCQHCDANIGKGPKLKKTIIKKKASETTGGPKKLCPECKEENWCSVRICACKHAFFEKKEPKKRPV